ncbi:Bug family tripartite tricarboxylate transporter substrate binding protein [Plastoroseomonas arctica]|uniref:Tripartite tricarboxylate transporter substrate binding protein n=1 Tax=Plastoroseomonas arctica TaxID=1509237 RepID=A0AAF1KUW1_9PROT|nr:tripartite tricarboxylate transporter substrate binding protein [Plastoroseomonas arctica]MBR0657222.1 tripartite tricarboxylate transporter substrate binding protein [Plastoroseomonas arctica]
MTNATLSRRAALAGIAATSLARPALSQAAFPSRPIRMIIPWAAGGTTDVQMRAICEATSRRIGQPVIADNRPGAGGTLGPAALLNLPPDGYTLAQIPISVFRYPHMTARPTFDPLSDFTYVAHLTGYLFGIVVKADAPWRTIGEFLDFAKANPGVVNYGSPGVGTSLHITMEQIAGQRGIEWTHVPFRGIAENMPALLGGQVHAVADSSGWTPLVEAGQLRLLCSWGPERAKRFPNVPTLRESGIDIVSASPYGVAGPKGMDPGVVRVLQEAFRAAMDDPQHVSVLDRFDMPPMFMPAAEYDAFARRQFADEGVMIRRMNLRL